LAVARAIRILQAVLGFICAILGVGLLVAAVFETDPTPPRILSGVLAVGFLGVSFLLYRSSGRSRGDVATGPR
jgi:hypothetical protein